jgi:hypothetical protein
MEIAAEEDSLRTQAMCLAQRHAGPQTVDSRLIGSAGDHPTSSRVATHDHRLAPQVRVIYLLHRDKEGIEVNMENTASHFTPFIKNMCSILIIAIPQLLSSHVET